MNALQQRLQAAADKKRHAELNNLFCEVQPTLEAHYSDVIHEVFAAINALEVSTPDDVYQLAADLLIEKWS